jgi:peptide/nickel transport system permease protein
LSVTTPDFPAALDLPAILPEAKQRGRIAGFIYRHPTICAGGLLVGVMIFIAIFAPYLGTKDPTALAPAKRTR